MENADNFFNKFINPKILKHLKDKGINLDTSSIEQDRDKREHEADIRATQAYMKRKRSDIFHSSLVSADVDMKQTFDDFNVTNDKQNDELEQVMGIATKIKNGEPHKNILYGKPGTGKTMLSICLLNSLKDRYSCLFVDLSEFIRLTKLFKDERANLQVNSLYKAMNDADVLVLDDVGSESSMRREITEASSYNQKILFNISQRRAGKETIITTNNNGNELKQIYDDRIISKLIRSDDPENIIKFDSEDYRKYKN